MDKTGKSQWTGSEIRVLAIVMLINIVDGLDNQLLPLSVGVIAREWDIGPAAFSAAISAGFLGAALGTPLGGWMGDRFGRKTAILFGMMLFGLFTAAMAFCATTDQFVAARLLSGIGLGACLPPMLALVVESVSEDKRGTAVAMTMLSMPLGLTLSGVVIPRLQLALGWSTAFLYCAIAVFAAFAIAALFLREPPRPVPGALPDARPEAPDLPAHAAKPGHWQALTREMDRSALIATMGAIFLVYVVMSTALSWLPSFALGQGMSQIVSGQTISFWSIAGMVGTLLAGWAVNRLGGIRATYLVVGGFALACLTSAAMFAVMGEFAGALYFAAALSGLLASGAITVLYAAATQIVPQRVRSSGMSIVTLAGKAGGVVGGASGVAMLALPGLHLFFLAMGMVAGAACLVMRLGTKRQADKARDRLPAGL